MERAAAMAVMTPTPIPISLSSLLEIILLGTILQFVANPDYFFNPINGLFKSVSFFTTEAIIPPFVRLDNLTYYSLASFGVGCTCLTCAHFLANNFHKFRNDHLLRRELMRAKGWFAALLAHVFVHVAFVYEDMVGINKVAVAFFAGIFTVYSLWALSENIQFSKQQPNIPRTKATALQLSTFCVEGLFAAIWAVQLLWFPKNLEPGTPMSLIKSTQKEDNTLMDINLFTARLEGVPIMAVVLCRLEIILLDRSVEAIRAHNKFALVCLFLYICEMLRAMVGCQYVDKIAVVANVGFMVAFSTFIFKCGPNILEDSQPTDATIPAEEASSMLDDAEKKHDLKPQEEHDLKPQEEPNLVPDEGKNKVA